MSILNILQTYWQSIFIQKGFDKTESYNAGKDHKERKHLQMAFNSNEIFYNGGHRCFWDGVTIKLLLFKIFGRYGENV